MNVDRRFFTILIYNAAKSFARLPLGTPENENKRECLSIGDHFLYTFTV